MFCSNCGMSINTASSTCPRCGKPFQTNASGQAPVDRVNLTKNTAPQNNAAQSYQEDIMPQARNGYQQNYTAPNTMTWKGIKQMGYVIDNKGQPTKISWMKFILYFQLFAFAVFQLIGGIANLSGIYYGGNKDLVYAKIDGLQGLDTFFGLSCIVLAVLAVVTRFLLSGLKKSGPVLYLTIHLLDIVITLIYIIAFSSITTNYGIEVDLFSETARSLLTSTAFLIASTVYFKRISNIFRN